MINLLAEVTQTIMNDPELYGIPDGISLGERQHAALMITDRLKNNPDLDLSALAESTTDYREIEASI